MSIKTGHRYKIVFPEKAAYYAALAVANPDLTVSVPVSSERHMFIAIEPITFPGSLFRLNLASVPRGGGSQLSETGFASFSDEAAEAVEIVANMYRKEFGAQVVEDFQYDLDIKSKFDFFRQYLATPHGTEASLDDVLRQINAQDAWSLGYKGQNVHIAVVDSGIDGSNPEFPLSRRSGGWAVKDDDPWSDWHGHGTMCATIAAASRAPNGRFDGVAPETRIISCKTRYYDSELTEIFEFLAERARTDKWLIVATNSYGRYTGTPPPPPGPGNTFTLALERAIAEGVHVFFSAGNNHILAGGKSDTCDPTSIWLHKAKADLMTVATCDLSGQMWDYSSRGPGQDFEAVGNAAKPNVTAPTPKNGKILFGNQVRVLADGWGTSGACPQVAGLAALLLSKNPAASRLQLFDAIQRSAMDLGHTSYCQGSGRINCKAALSLV